MANLLTRLFDIGTKPTFLQEADSTISELRSINLNQQFEVDRLQESMTDLITFVEDLNWERIAGWESDKGFPLEAIKKNADILQSFATVNPTLKKAINARIGYIWSQGVAFPDAPKRILENPRNINTIFSKTAQGRMEMQLATNGNAWALHDKRNDEISFIPIDQIAGWVSDPTDTSRVLYWLRSYTVTTKNFRTGEINNPEHIEVFYPANDNTNTKLPSIDGIKVDRNFEVVHIAANRQEGWVLGVPDLMAAMFWAKGHKELFEAGASYVKAQGRFASKVVAKTANGANNTAARLADQPRRDPDTGQVLDGAGTAIMSGGLDYQLMGKMSGGVDFDQFDPVAGLIAAGLDIPRDVILAKSGSDEISLEQTVVDAMTMRRDLWDNFFVGIFGAKKGNVVWPKIRTETEYRRMQAVGLANDVWILQRSEMRQLALEAFGIEGDPNDLPPMDENPKILVANAIANNSAENQQELAQQQSDAASEAAEKAAQSALPDQGVTGGVGKLSNGSDEKANRANSKDRDAK